MTPESGEFKNFKDLMRSRGGEPEKPSQPAPDRGWTLEDGSGTKDVSDEDLAAMRDPDASSRARIAARPAAFGPMTHGPPPYKDPESEEMELVSSFRIRTVFPPDVLKEMEGLPDEPRPEDIRGRLDLRGETIFTIDGADAKDFDDAISMRVMGEGFVELGVHIADVGHYVVPGTALDDEALARGTSVYLPDQVVPMLPEELSNGLCSLVPERDRLAFSVFMTFDAKGERTATRVAKSVIRSVRRNTYKEVQELLDAKPGEGPQELRFLEADLRRFEDWTRQQQKIRDAKGALRITSTERRFVFDAKHEVEAVIDAPRYFSQTLIEETALAANQAVGDLFHDRGLPTIYRVHPEKDPEEIEKVAEMLLEHGIRVPTKERLSGRDIGRLIRQARRRPNAEALIPRIMGLVERAVYEVKDHEDVAEHWGLARKAYLHFTSPIRRYPDLIVHRWLHGIEGGDDGAEAELKTDDLLDDLNHVAQHSSTQADVAEMAEHAVGDLKVCQYMEPHIGERIDAQVLRISRGGIEVKLTEYNVTGFLPMRMLGSRPKFTGSSVTIQAGKRHLSFTEGHSISVQLKDVDFLRLQILLDLA